MFFCLLEEFSYGYRASRGLLLSTFTRSQAGDLCQFTGPDEIQAELSAVCGGDSHRSHARKQLHGLAPGTQAAFAPSEDYAQINTQIRSNF